MRELWTTTYGFPLSEEGDGGEPPTSNALQLAERKRRSATVVELEKDENARGKGRELDFRVDGAMAMHHFTP